ncbi:MAG: hypothetical protein AAB377_02145, partial [Patescibacteria group bacterium]
MMTMKKALITSKEITSGQKKQIKRFIQDAGEEIAEISAMLETAIAKVKELSVSSQFSNEEMSSKYGYLSGYKP